MKAPDADTVTVSWALIKWLGGLLGTAIITTLTFGISWGKTISRLTQLGPVVKTLHKRLDEHGAATEKRLSWLERHMERVETTLELSDRNRTPVHGIPIPAQLRGEISELMEAPTEPGGGRPRRRRDTPGEDE